MKGERLGNSTATDLTGGHLLLGSGCQATTEGLWEEMSGRGPSTSSIWGPLVELLGLALVNGRIRVCRTELTQDSGVLGFSPGSLPSHHVI